jgi:hypothetical protein
LSLPLPLLAFSLVVPQRRNLLLSLPLPLHPGPKARYKQPGSPAHVQVSPKTQRLKRVLKESALLKGTASAVPQVLCLQWALAPEVRFWFVTKARHILRAPLPEARFCQNLSTPRICG